MTADEKRYWFPAKRYGWGWGAPRTWQGWAVLALFTLVVGVAAIAGEGGPWSVVGIGVATAALLGIAGKTGEPTRWRWGREN